MIDLKSEKDKQSILELLQNDQKVFMQIINDKNHNFMTTINEEQKRAFAKHKHVHDIIDSMYASPRVKSGLWQTLKLLKEIIEIKGYQPQHVVVEFARDEQTKGKRTESRKQNLVALYKSMPDGKEVLNELNQYEDKDINERLYLYYLQKGKCAYSQKSLDITNLSSYEVDHIVPQSIIKDDSLDNKVLVISKENQRKSDLLFIKPEVIQSNYIFWQKLKDSKLMSPKKFFNLTRRGDDQDEQKAIEGFIQRQLVETRQTLKYFKNIVENLYPEIQVIPLRAKPVSDYRKEQNLYKSRSLNNFHHAKDAYLIAALGKFAITKYPYMFNPKQFYNQSKYNKHNVGLHRLIHKEFKDYDTQTVIWDGNNAKTMIQKMMKQNDVLVTAQVYETKGPLFNQTIYSKNDKNAKIPRNKQMEDVSKYGGHSGLVPAYMAIVEGKNQKGKLIKRLVNIPVLYKNNSEKLVEYINETYKIEFTRFIKEKIYKNTLVETEGMKVRLSSAPEWNNAVELFFTPPTEFIVYKLEHNYSLENQEYYYLYTEILNKLNKFYPMFSGLEQKMTDQAEEFNNLSQADKRSALLQLLSALKGNKAYEAINHGTLKLGSSVGRMNGKNLKIEQTSFVFESVTGLRVVRWSL